MPHQSPAEWDAAYRLLIARMHGMGAHCFVSSDALLLVACVIYASAIDFTRPTCVSTLPELSAKVNMRGLGSNGQQWETILRHVSYPKV